MPSSRVPYDGPRHHFERGGLSQPSYRGVDLPISLLSSVRLSDVGSIRLYNRSPAPPRRRWTAEEPAIDFNLPVRPRPQSAPSDTTAHATLAPSPPSSERDSLKDIQPGCQQKTKMMVNVMKEKLRAFRDRLHDLIAEHFEQKRLAKKSSKPPQQSPSLAREVPAPNDAVRAGDPWDHPFMGQALGRGSRTKLRRHQSVNGRTALSPNTEDTRDHGGSDVCDSTEESDVQSDAHADDDDDSPPVLPRGRVRSVHVVNRRMQSLANVEDWEERNEAEAAGISPHSVLSDHVRAEQMMLMEFDRNEGRGRTSVRGWYWRHA
ncbi:hypothetical protein CAC42_7499 [Sphaceloma murrayae]|uniref:Uncharacterized protein n=1 Tax=Sphaceloma murrayae TaxID=2082308 RepID=A0A2K1QX69_9PEZI|nr:hypothetical protein CAC42_7499 [Sphaceloma murrayae]